MQASLSTQGTSHVGIRPFSQHSPVVGRVGSGIWLLDQSAAGVPQHRKTGGYQHPLFSAVGHLKEYRPAAVLVGGWRLTMMLPSMHLS